MVRRGDRRRPPPLGGVRSPGRCAVVVTRLPLPGSWRIAIGDVVLIVTRDGLVHHERYGRVIRVRRRDRRVVALTTADGRQYVVSSVARLRYTHAAGEHVGGLGVMASEVRS